MQAPIFKCFVGFALYSVLWASPSTVFRVFFNLKTFLQKKVQNQKWLPTVTQKVKKLKMATHFYKKTLKVENKILFYFVLIFDLKHFKRT